MIFDTNSISIRNRVSIDSTFLLISILFLYVHVYSSTELKYQFRRESHQPRPSTFLSKNKGIEARQGCYDVREPFSDSWRARNR